MRPGDQGFWVYSSSGRAFGFEVDHSAPEVRVSYALQFTRVIPTGDVDASAAPASGVMLASVRGALTLASRCSTRRSTSSRVTAAIGVSRSRGNAHLRKRPRSVSTHQRPRCSRTATSVRTMQRRSPPRAQRRSLSGASAGRGGAHLSPRAQSTGALHRAPSPPTSPGAGTSAASAIRRGG